MGLKEGTAVGTSIVDAHAGVIGELLMFSYYDGLEAAGNEMIYF